MDPDPTIGNVTVTNFTVDPDYACTMFKSCQKVSLIAAASIQSSEAFLDFLVNISFHDRECVGVQWKTKRKVNY